MDKKNRQEELENWDAPRRRGAKPVREQRYAESGKRKPAKPKKRARRLRKLVTTLVVLAVLLLSGAYALVSHVYDKMQYVEIQSLAQAPFQEKGAVNILLIGNDSRSEDEQGRSDAMILLTVSTRTKKVYLTSLLRDMYVEIPGQKGNRLNAAYAYGGPALLLQTIEQNLDIPVSRYVLVDFKAFANLVDGVGGVELSLTKKEKEYVNGYLVEYNMLTDRPQGTDNIDASQDGMVHLNGPQALAYTRNRYIGTDFGRTERQRKVLGAVFHKLPGALATNPTGLIEGVFPNLTTNLKKSECYRLALSATRMIAYDLEQNCIPIEGSYRDATVRGMAVLQVDFETNRAYLQEKIYGAEGMSR